MRCFEEARGGDVAGVRRVEVGHIGQLFRMDNDLSVGIQFPQLSEQSIIVGSFQQCVREGANQYFRMFYAGMLEGVALADVAVDHLDTASLESLENLRVEIDDPNLRHEGGFVT